MHLLPRTIIFSKMLRLKCQFENLAGICIILLFISLYALLNYKSTAKSSSLALSTLHLAHCTVYIMHCTCTWIWTYSLHTTHWTLYSAHHMFILYFCKFITSHCKHPTFGHRIYIAKYSLTYLSPLIETLEHRNRPNHLIN